MAYNQPKRKGWKRWAVSGFIFGVVFSLFLVPDSPVGPKPAQAALPEIPETMMGIFLVLVMLAALRIRKTLLAKPR